MPIVPSRPTITDLVVKTDEDDILVAFATDRPEAVAYYILSPVDQRPTADQIMQPCDQFEGCPQGAVPVTGSGRQPGIVIAGVDEGRHVLHLVLRDARGRLSAPLRSDIVQIAQHVAPTPGVSAQIQLVQRSQLRIAPEAMFFEVALDGFDAQPPRRGGVYDPQFHGLYYYWDFGDSYSYQTPTQVQNKDAGRGTGPLGAHTYRKPGTYTITCRVYEPASGKLAIARGSIEVKAPDTVFAAPRQTIVVDQTGRGLAQYPRAAVVSSPEEAMRVIYGNQSETFPVRVIFRRGQVFSCDGLRFGGNRSRKMPSVHFLASEEVGDRPVIRFRSEMFWNDKDKADLGFQKDFIWQGIECVGGWDPQTETGQPFSCFSMFDHAPKQFLLDSCVIRNFGDLSIYARSGNNRTFLNDTLITAWGNYGFLDGRNEVTAITGSAIVQDPLANAGGPKTRPLSRNNHSGYRVAVPKRVLFQNSEMYARNDWIESDGIWGQQPNIRFDTNGEGGGKLSIQNCVFEGGNDIITFGAERQFVNKPINAVVEKSYFLASHATRNGMAISKGGITIRNNIVVVPETPTYKGYGIRTLIHARYRDEDDAVPKNRDSPVRIYNNSLVNLSRRAPRAVVLEGFTAGRVANNLYYAPNSDPRFTQEGPLDQTVVFLPREGGYKDKTTPLQTAYATPETTAAHYAPQDGSSALGTAADDLVAYDDFDGRPRPMYPSKGARERKL